MGQMSHFEPSRPPFSSAGYTQPPIPTPAPHERPATRGDINDVVKELQAVRGVLEQIYEFMRNQAHVR
jgi:hypothetical protein